MNKLTSVREIKDRSTALILKMERIISDWSED